MTFNNVNKASRPIFDTDEAFYSSKTTVGVILKKLNNKKSFGVDKIPNIALKRLPGVIVIQLVIIFNNALNNGYFPTRWKLARIKLLVKKEKREN